MIVTAADGGEFLLGLSRDVREAAGVEAGDTVEVEIELDLAPREVELPPTLAGDPEARTAFDRLSYTDRKEYARWIEEARRDETREQRIAQALEQLRRGMTRR